MNKPTTKPSLSGIFSISATNADTGEERFITEFPNLILNQGLNLMGTTGIMGRCAVGTGSTPPVVTNGTLQSPLATSSGVLSASSGNPGTGYGFVRRIFRFNPGVAAGNISEIGIAAASGELFSRSLVKDMDGNPTTITVLSNEYLDVTYELRQYWPTADVTFDAVIGGATYACVMRPAAVNSAQWIPLYYDLAAAGGNGNYSVWDGDIGANTGGPSGTGQGGFGSTDNTYVNNSLAATSSLPFTIDQGNFGTGIKSLSFATRVGIYQCSFTPPIPKNNTQGLTFQIGMAWARHA